MGDIPRIARDALIAAASLTYSFRHSATPVWSQDWDILCVLDGCRFDLMREVADRGEFEAVTCSNDVESRWSVGSQSAEWMDRTFAPEFAHEMAQTAYLTGNPFSAQSGGTVRTVTNGALPLRDDDFAVLYEAWRDEWKHGEISTIPPGPLTDAAIGIWRQRQSLNVNRIIVHYMQPHTPFRSRPDWFLGQANTTAWGQIKSDNQDDENGGDDDDLLAQLDEATLEELRLLETDDSEGFKDPWTRVRDQELPFYEFWGAYRDNLIWVLDDVQRLLNNCDGRIVLTSDHGNGIGVWDVWSHPPGVAIPAVRRVPWVPLEGRDLRTHRPGVPNHVVDSSVRDDAVEARLADLGYR
jgi:hypothetical protein